jgi:adenine-specific DNA methylase
LIAAFVLRKCAQGNNDKSMVVESNENAVASISTGFGSCPYKQAVNDLICKANTKHIFVSYNNEGIMSLDGIKSILEQRGEYYCFTKKYKRFQADLKTNRNIKGDETVEYLHYVKIK